MRTIAQLVYAYIIEDPQALDYLHRGLLNTTTYAHYIKPKLEETTLQVISTNSIITALSRIKKSIQSSSDRIPRFVIQNIDLKFPITEFVYTKDYNPHRILSSIYEQIEDDNRVHLNVINVSNELDIFVSSSAETIISNGFDEFQQVVYQNKLAAVILKYDPKYREYPGMASQILNALASRNIVMVECVTTYSEFTIYLSQTQSQKAVETLQEKFMS